MKRIAILLSLMVFSSIGVLGQYTISGTVLYHQNPEYPIEGTVVNLFDENGVQVASTISDENGVYNFEDLGYGTFTLSASVNLPGAQVTVQEAVYILMYLNGLYQLTPVQFMAADVDGNGIVNQSDFIFIIRNHWIFNQPFPAGSWAFEEIEVNTGTREGGPSNIGGTKIGDVEGVFVPTGRDLINEFQIVEMGTFEVLAGTEIMVPVYANTPSNLMSGYGVVLAFDSEIIEVLEVEAFGSDAFSTINNGAVRIGNLAIDNGIFSNYNGQVAQVKIKVLKDQMNEFFPFSIGSESHIIGQKGKKEGVVDFGMPSLKPVKNVQIQTNSIFPNPATSQLTLSIHSESNSTSEIMFIDQSGRMARIEKMQIKSGIFDYTVSIDELKPGVYQVVVYENNLNKVLLSQRLVKL
ncbi:MAG: T9SS type A sorting domain-containing protein [Bacteroidales bacterium]|nr:T9SS type A sorting domain-containing protein [Bacteroidales bacterium]